MAARFRTKDRVLETSITTGTGTYTLAGAATGFQTFVGGDVAANDLVPYYAEDGTNWEAGIGTVLSGPARLERTTVLSSSTGSAINWGTGTRNLRCGWPAELNTPRYKSVSIAGAAGTQVLTQDEQRCDILNLTGALTGNRVIEVDTAPWRWAAVINNTTGAYTVTLKVTGLTGVAITQTKARPLICNGTDVIDPATDAVPAAATQAEQEAGTSVAAFVTPGRQHYHPSAAKFFVSWDNAGGILGNAYNVTSVTDSGAGLFVVNIATDFSTQYWVGHFNALMSDGALKIPYIAAIAAGTLTCRVRDIADSGYADATGTYFASGFGDQA